MLFSLRRPLLLGAIGLWILRSGGIRERYRSRRRHGHCPPTAAAGPPANRGDFVEFLGNDPSGVQSILITMVARNRPISLTPSR